MLQSTKDFITILFGAVYQMTGITFPGTTYSIRQVLFGALIIGLLISVLRRHFVGDSGANSSARGIGGGNNRNIKVSDERKGDSR